MSVNGLKWAIPCPPPDHIGEGTVTPSLRPAETVFRMDVDLDFIEDDFVKDHIRKRPDEPVDIVVRCPNHDIAYDVLVLLDETYFPEDPDPEEES